MKTIDDVIWSVLLREDEIIDISEELLERYLNECRLIQLSYTEKLRHLAIALEDLQLRNGWTDLNRLYERASQDDPNDARIFQSWAISSLEFFQYEIVNSSNYDALSSIALAGLEAIEYVIGLDPRCSENVYIKGLINYHYPVSESNAGSPFADNAMLCFKEAIELSSVHEMAKLYLGHCYMDKHRWSDAVVAYKSVDQEKLVELYPSAVWRTFKLDEEIACCYAHLGDNGSALQMVDSLLDRIEALLDDEACDLIVNLDELVEVYRMNIMEGTLSKRVLTQLYRLQMAELYGM